MTKSATHRTVSIADIVVPADRRGTDVKTIECLADSIATLGLLNPILIREDRNEAGEHGKLFILVAGLHRLEALKVLGRKDAECLLMADDDLRVELAEIDENLCRSELSQAEIAAAISRRKKIYIALHPETVAGKSQAKGMNAKLGRGDVSEHCSPTFAAATATASGMNRRTIEKAAARGEAITPEKLQKIVGTSLDKAGELDALAKMPMPQRDQLIEAAASGQIVTARDSLKGNTHSSPAHAEGDARTGMAALPKTPEGSAEAPKASCAKVEAAPSGVRSDAVTDNTTAHARSQANSTAAAPLDPVSEVKWAIDRCFPLMDDVGRGEIASYAAKWSLDDIPDFLKRAA